MSGPPQACSRLASCAFSGVGLDLTWDDFMFLQVRPGVGCLARVQHLWLTGCSGWWMRRSLYGSSRPGRRETIPALGVASEPCHSRSTWRRG
jgi:hypothetical protein